MSIDEDLVKFEGFGDFGGDFMDMNINDGTAAAADFNDLDMGEGGLEGFPYNSSLRQDDDMGMGPIGYSSFDGPYNHQHMQQQHQSAPSSFSQPPPIHHILDAPPSLHSTANSSAENTPDLVAERQLAERRARDNIRRGLLYRSGAGARVPKTKKKKQYAAHSSFVLLPELHTSTHAEGSSIPPQAHEEMFRMVTNNTIRSKNDPERIFYDTSTSSIRNVPQPPWYCGRQNKIRPSDSSMLTAANRYGFRGAKDIREYQTKYYMPPESTRTETTPHFLSGNCVVDEYVPVIRSGPILGGKASKVSYPGAWPANAAHPSGYKLKQRPISPSYNAQTTVGDDAPMNISKSLVAYFERLATEKEFLNNSVQLESMRKLAAPPSYEKMRFDSTWNDWVAANASGSLRLTMQQQKDHVPALQTKIPEGDKLVYSGSSVFLLHSGSNDLSAHEAAHEDVTSLEYKWRQIINATQSVKGKIRREQTVRQVLLDLTTKLLEKSIRLGEKGYIDRPHFITSMCEAPCMEAVPLRQKQILFSIFDQMKENNIRFVLLMASMILLDSPPGESAVGKLSTLWDMYDQYCIPLPPLDRALEILTLFSGSNPEKHSMEAVFNREFKPACYRYGIRFGDPNFSYGLSMKFDMKQQKMKSFPAAYSVCDNVIGRVAFPEILHSCPNTVAEFETQFQARVASYNGSNPIRY